MSEDEDGKNGRERLSPADQGSQSERAASVACRGSRRNGSRPGGQDRAARIAKPCARGVHSFDAAGPDGLFDNRTDGPTQTETSYDDLRRAGRRRDPGCIDPLRHVFEDAMSGVIPRRRVRFLPHGCSSKSRFSRDNDRHSTVARLRNRQTACLFSMRAPRKPMVSSPHSPRSGCLQTIPLSAHRRQPRPRHAIAEFSSVPNAVGAVFSFPPGSAQLEIKGFAMLKEVPCPPPQN
jgi:hypothetical protein